MESGEFRQEMERLPYKDREELERIFRGELCPPLMSDAIAKRIFSPDLHPERLEFLLRGTAGDMSISVASPAGHEGLMLGRDSKKVIFDIPAILTDGTRADAEIQVAAQECIFPRADIYGANLLTVQYSATEGQAKGDVGFKDAPGVLLAVYMRHSPKAFRDFKSPEYVHRFFMRRADSGLEYVPKVRTVYVQLDKALEKFRGRGYNCYGDSGILALFAAMADSNDREAAREVSKIGALDGIMDEARQFAQDREVQAMLVMEKINEMDWNSMRQYERQEGWNEGRQEGWQEGHQKGWQEGHQETYNECLNKIASNYLKTGLSMEEAMEKAKELLA